MDVTTDGTGVDNGVHTSDGEPVVTAEDERLTVCASGTNGRRGKAREGCGKESKLHSCGTGLEGNERVWVPCGACG